MTTDPRPHLLPPSSTPLERAVAQALAAAFDYPVLLRELWNPATCPLDALPFLAWARSVDWWNEDWPEAKKRAFVTSAFEVHRKKGTLGALRRVVEPFAFTLDALEWWQTTPQGQRGTFDLFINLNSQAMGERDESEIERLLEETRPLTRHVGCITFINTQRSTVPYIGAAVVAGEVVTLYPRPDTQHIDISAPRVVGASARLVERTRIE